MKLNWCFSWNRSNKSKQNVLHFLLFLTCRSGFLLFIDYVINKVIKSTLVSLVHFNVFHKHFFPSINFLSNYVILPPSFMLIFFFFFHSVSAQYIIFCSQLPMGFTFRSHSELLFSVTNSVTSSTALICWWVSHSKVKRLITAIKNKSNYSLHIDFRFIQGKH